MKIPLWFFSLNRPLESVCKKLRRFDRCVILLKRLKIVAGVLCLKKEKEKAQSDRKKEI